MTELSANKKSFVVYMTQSELHAAYGFDLLVKDDSPELFFDELAAAGLFAAAKNPSPQPADKEGFYRIPFWPALSYLTHVARKAGDKDDSELGAKLVALVRAFTAYRDPDGQPIDNYHTYSACAEIVGGVPLKCVTAEDLEMTGQWLSSRWGNDTVMSVLDKYIFQRFLAADSRESIKLIPALRHCTELRVDPQSTGESRKFKPVADDYWLEQLLEHNSAALGSKCGQPAVDCLLDRLRVLFSDEYISENTWMFRAAIEDHDQNHSWDHVTNAFVDGARDSLNSWLSSGDPDAARRAIALVSDSDQIIRRVGINAIREHWSILHDSFETLIEPRLFDVGHLHELYILLYQHFNDLSAKAQARILEVIATLGQPSEGEGEGEGEEPDISRAQYLQRNWLLALSGTGNPRATQELARLNEVCGPIREHPDLISYSTSSWGFGPSPYSKEEILAFAKDRSLLTRLGAFHPEQRFGESPLKSLSDALVSSVSEHPLDFLWALEAQMPIDRRTQYGLIAGLLQALDAKKQPGIEASRSVARRLIPYAHAIAVDVAFWKEAVPEADALEPTKNWIPSKLTELVKLVSANEEIPLTSQENEQLFATAHSVLLRSEGISHSEDPMTSAINNNRGTAFESLLQLLLRSCRDADRTGADHADAWELFHSFLDSEIDGCSGAKFEVSTLVGCYFAQLLYVDEAWVRSRMGSIFPSNYPLNFACAIYGLAFTPVGSKVYETIRLEEVPQRALLTPEVKGSGRERLIERIAVAYSWGQESLDSEAMTLMFREEFIDDLCELLSTIARWHSAKLSEDHIARATELARRAVEFGSQNPATRQRVLAEASKFIDYLQQVSSEDMRWLAPAARYAHAYHGAYEFAESLDRLAEVSPAQVAELLEAFLENYRPTYDYQDRLQSTIRKLDSSGQRIVALRVLDGLVRGGLRPFLELYEEIAARPLH